MSKGLKAKAGLAMVAAGVSVLAGCAGSGEGMGLGEMLLTGGATQAPVQVKPMDDVYCPPVEIFEGGSTLRSGTDSTSLRNQIALTNVARECVGQPDGSTLVKVGVEARALLGVSGGAGRYNVPVQILVKEGSTVIANRSRTAVAVIPAGSSHATVTIVEDGIIVPAARANSFEIEVGLGGRGGRG
jgi:hypothetical protein